MENQTNGMNGNPQYNMGNGYYNPNMQGPNMQGPNNMGNGYYNPNMQGPNNMGNGYYNPNMQGPNMQGPNNMGNGYYNPNMQGPNYANNMQNGYNQQVNPNKKNLFAILSLIFGGISVVAGIIYRIFLYNTTTYSYRYLYGNAVWSIIMMYVAIPLAIAGLTLGILGIVKAKKYVNEQSYKIMSIIGIAGSAITGILTLFKW